MKTERLYYNDSYLLEFDAKVVETKPVGQRLGVILDKTAFYPTSGGQLHDLGTLNGVNLVDCIEEDESGKVVHVLEESINGDSVHGQIDRDRRLDHMQQHSGQHVLSHAFVELFDWPTVSFHMGAVSCTIDLPVESISHEQADKAVELANQIVLENRGVAVRYVAHDNIAEAGLRKATERTGDIRIIDIAGYDRSACGGTHVRMTGEIGPILITGTERSKKQTRVEFICGTRVLRYAKQANRTLAAISQTVSAAPFDTAAAVRTLWDEHQRGRKRIEDLESELMDHEAAQFPIVDGVAAGTFKRCSGLRAGGRKVATPFGLPNFPIPSPFALLQMRPHISRQQRVRLRLPRLAGMLGVIRPLRIACHDRGGKMQFGGIRFECDCFLHKRVSVSPAREGIQHGLVP